MVKLIHLEPGPVSEDLRAELAGLRLFSNRPEEANRRLEMDVAPAPENLPTGSALILFREPLYDLVHIVDRLLGPGGCPWDREQTHESLKKYLLEEAYEVLDAIDTGSMPKLQEELGDLLLQPVLHAQMEKVEGTFDIDAVAQGISDKLVRRHPHVFGDIDVEDADEVLRNWDRIKQSEKGKAQPQSILAGVPTGMASLLRAHEVSKRAVRVGFEWPNLESVFAKLREEEAELKDAISKGDHREIESEIGDLLFTVVNIARWSGVEPEEALRKMLNRFTERFMHMEAIAEQDLSSLTPEEWNDLWEAAKSRENGITGTL